MQIICADYDETVHRLNVLGSTVSKVNWHQNAITIDPAVFADPAKFPKRDPLTRTDEQIQNVKNLRIDLYGVNSK